MSRHRALVLVLTALTGAALLAALPGGAAPAPAPEPAAAAGTACPPGYEPVGRAEPTGDHIRDRMAAAISRSVSGDLGCISVKRPENAIEMAMAHAELAARRTGGRGPVAPGAHTAALAQRKALAGPSAIQGTAGEWEPIGNTPLYSNDPDMNSVNDLGLAELAGRIQDFAYDPETDAVYVSVAQGGVYKSLNRGDSWFSISDTLPNLTVGSVAWSPYDGGRLVVITGDSNGGGNSVVGTGAYWSDDDGKTWHKSTGTPDGVLGFRVVVDPTNASEFYAATGAGLFRSTDGGRTFVNVNLPTGDCAGEPAVHPCFFANQVTDVVVQSPDEFGNQGGFVVAAVGWRAGTWRDNSDTVQAPANGLYGSETGEPDSFERLDEPTDGFAAQERIGRIELGTTEGPDQNHDYLYAIVQDAVKFNGGVPVGDANEVANPVIGYNNALEGIYVSRDFGDTWLQMIDGETLSEGAAAWGSALSVTTQALGVGPGVQAWYNMFIKPDPTRTEETTGAPTRLLFGLEEVWQNEFTDAPAVGPTPFKVIGRYFAGNTCFFLGVPALPYCPPYRGEPQGGTTTHPDQHGVLFLPGPEEGGVTLLVGNDGGTYKQVVGAGDEFSNQEWGVGHNVGFHTLMPYSLAVGNNGVVWSGLQDNGHMKIEPSGRQVMTFGGDGTWSAVDPEDADVAYEATPGGLIRVTTDGGRSWRSTNPPITGAAFVNQFALDPTDSAHLVTGGREIVESTNAPTLTWEEVFDLGTVENPGEEPAADDTSLPNRMSAVDVRGETIYVGWCGICDVVTQAGTFRSGIATNHGGDWHLAEGRGLPQRYVTSVTIDPDNPATVYVTLGGYARRWVPPGANGDAAEDIGEGNVFKSTDGGESFVDISGNLPDGPANWLEVRKDQLLVATDFGVFASANRSGQSWALLGDELDMPMAPAFHLAFRPGDDDHVYAALYGRGIYRYRFSGASVPAPPEQPPGRTPPKQPPPKQPPPKRIAATGAGETLPLLGIGAVLLAVVAGRRLRSGRA